MMECTRRRRYDKCGMGQARDGEMRVYMYCMYDFLGCVCVYSYACIFARCTCSISRLTQKPETGSKEKSEGDEEARGGW